MLKLAVFIISLLRIGFSEENVTPAVLLKFGEPSNLTQYDKEAIVSKIKQSPNPQSIKEIKVTTRLNGQPIKACLLSFVPPSNGTSHQRCEILKGRVCRPEFVLKFRSEVIEDCAKEKNNEVCREKSSKMTVFRDTIFCQRASGIICDSPQVENSQCSANRVAICQAETEMVSVTERRQKCGVGNRYRTTKMCLTWQDGRWTCKTFNDDDCSTKEVKKVIRTEATEGPYSCTQMTLEDVCHASNCRLPDDVDCVHSEIPKQVSLKEVTCTECTPGSTKITPVLVRKRVCRKSAVEHVCANVPDEDNLDLSKWQKVCISDLKKFAASTDIVKKFNDCIDDPNKCLFSYFFVFGKFLFDTMKWRRLLHDDSANDDSAIDKMAARF